MFWSLFTQWSLRPTSPCGAKIYTTSWSGRTVSWFLGFVSELIFSHITGQIGTSHIRLCSWYIFTLMNQVDGSFFTSVLRTAEVMWSDPPDLQVDLSAFSDPDDYYYLTVTAVIGQNESESAPADGFTYSYYMDAATNQICAFRF